MLKSLSIQNYALIDQLTINFPEGFTAITGETGAGKSILLGALSLLLGKRADFGVLMDNKKKCIVEGTFNISKLDLGPLFKLHDLDHDDNTIIRREIIPSGKSRAFINDTPVKLELLKLFGEHLVDIHSQHQTLALGQSQFQLQVLDSFINQEELKAEYSKYYDQFRLLSIELVALKELNEKAKREEDYFRFQYDELCAASLQKNETEELAEREKLLTHAEEVAQGIEFAKQILIESDDPIIEELNKVKERLLLISEYHTGFEGIVERLRSAQIDLNDIAGEIGRIEAPSEPDAAEIQKITERIDLIFTLQQKHHVSSIEELILLQKDYYSKLQGIAGNEERIEEVAAQLEKAKYAANQLAKQLHKIRLSDSLTIKVKVLELLEKLGMKDAAFVVEVEETDKLTPNGKDKVRFMFNANRGGRPNEIGQIASGGELSRLMLAIKSLINSENILPTVIFDEIDAGVSGEIAGKVGNILKSMSQHHQLIAITHLPQIAAKADNHLKAFKKIKDDRTVTLITDLDEKGRVDEVAKLLSDEKITHAARETAKELLSITR